MTRAEATARVLAAAREIAKEQQPPRFYKDDDTRKYPLLCDWLDALDACPPEDAVPVRVSALHEAPRFIHVPRDLHDARALAWRGWLGVLMDRDIALRNRPDIGSWGLAIPLEPGWWPTRDAEHAAWAGRYRVDTERGGGPGAGDNRAVAVAPAPSGPEVVAGGVVNRPCGTCGQPLYLHTPMCPQAGPAPAQSVAPVPKLVGNVKLSTGAAQGGYEQRLTALETAVMGHECAGPAELIDSARLDALAARIEKIEHTLRYVGYPDDGGPDAPA